MESLKWIQQIVFRDFSNLEANIISTSEILHVFRLKKDQKGLKYLPNFHVIFQAHKDNLTVRLVTFHGKTVDSLVFKKTENDEDIPDHIKDFMFKYSSEDMQLCQGIKREDALNVIEEHLIEFLNDVVIVRSIKCKFTIKSDTIRCEECTKIIPSIKVEPVVMTKIEHAEEVLKFTITEKKEDPDYAPDYDYYDDEGNQDWEEYKPISLPSSIKIEKIEKKPLKRKYQKCKPVLKVENAWKFSNGVKCEAIIEPIHPKEGERFVRSGTHPAKKSKYATGGSKASKGWGGKVVRGGRPTDAESQKFRCNYKCKICLRVYRSKPSFDEDQAKHAKFFDLTGQLKCPECKTMVDRSEMTDHFVANHPGKQCCIGCQKIVSDAEGDLRKHIVKYHHNQNICETCGRIFNDLRLFDIHVKSKHSDVRDHFCDRCGKAFAHPVILEKHQSHSCSTEEWNCPICAKMFSCRDKLRFHLATHCEHKPYLCRYCPYSSNKCDNICIHVKKVHKLRGHRDDTTVLQDVLQLQRNFIKEHLSKVNQTRLRKPYQRLDTGGAHPYSKANQVPQICHLCGKTYASGDSIRRHLDLHSGKRPYKCKICGYTALKASIITVRHFSMFHAEEGISENDILAVDETELEEMRDFSTREFLNLTPVNNLETETNTQE